MVWYVLPQWAKTSEHLSPGAYGLLRTIYNQTHEQGKATITLEALTTEAGIHPRDFGLALIELSKQKYIELARNRYAKFARDWIKHSKPPPHGARFLVRDLISAFGHAAVTISNRGAFEILPTDQDRATCFIHSMIVNMENHGILDTEIRLTDTGHDKCNRFGQTALKADLLRHKPSNMA